MAERIFVLDIGASKISALVADFSKRSGLANLFYETALRSSASDKEKGVGELLSAIRRSLEKKTKSPLPAACVTSNCDYVSTKSSSSAMALGLRCQRSVTSSDIRRLRTEALNLGLTLKEELLHDFSLTFKLDGKPISSEPVGAVSKNLELELLLVTCQAEGMDSLRKAMQTAQLKLKKVVFSGLASALSLRHFKSFSNDMIVVDIGAANTKMISFLNGRVRQAQLVGVGGNSLTKSISDSMQITVPLAEELKKRYASAASDSFSYSQDILIKGQAGYQSLKRGFLCQKMHSGLAQLVEAISDLVKKRGLSEHTRVFVCGGGALLEGLLEALEQKIGHKIILSHPDLLAFEPAFRSNFFRSPAQSTLLGLINFATGRSQELLANEEQKPLPLVKGFVENLKSLYCDYF